MSCQVSKRKGSKREKCQKKKEHNARKAIQRGVMMLSGWRIVRITITVVYNTVNKVVNKEETYL